MLVRGAKQAEIAVGIAGRHGDVARAAFKAQGAAIADCFPRIRFTKLRDAAIKADDWLHRVRQAGKWVAAVKRDARANEIEAKIRAEKYAGRIG
jgi:hypothetical protein